MIAPATLVLFTLLGPPEETPNRSSEQVDVVAIEPAPAPEPEREPDPDPTAAIDRPVPVPEPEPEPEPARTWQVELFADIFYAVNSNLPDNHVMRGFVTSPRSGELSPNVVGAFVRHRANDDEPWWFELGIHAGPAVDALVAAEPNPGGVDSRYAGVEVFKHIALANAGFRIRKSKTSIGAGVFESPLGISSFWTFRNPNYTPTWQSNIVPYYLAGARISQEIPGGVTLSGWVVNGAQTYADVNEVPSGLLSLAFSPAPRKRMQALTISSHVLFGPEGLSIAPEDWLILSDTTIAWELDDRFSMAVVWDIAVENPGRIKADQNLYTAGGIMARGTLFENDIARLELAVRPDVLWDRDGRFFGVRRNLVFTPTATANLWLWDHLMLRLEYRFDQSVAEAGFFYRGAATTDGAPGLAQRQHTVFMALTGLWDFWFGRRGKPEAAR